MNDASGLRFSPYALPPLVGFIVLIVLSSLLISRRRRGGPHLPYAMVNLATAAWNLDVFLLYTLRNPRILLYIDRMFQPVIVLIPLLWINFVTIYLRSRHRKSLLAVYALISMPLVLISTTGLFINGTVPMYFGHYGQAGHLYFLYVFTHLSALVVVISMLATHYLKLAGALMKKQIGYFLIATVIIGLLSADNFFPLYGVEKYPMGNIAVFFYLIIVGVAIIRHGFMDIGTFVRKSIIYSVATFLVTSFYLGMVLLMEGLVRVYLLPESLFIPLVPAMVVAFMFQGVKQRVQSRLDSLFDHERKRTAMLSSFARSTQTTSTRGELASRFCRKIEKALHPERLAFFARDFNTGYWRLEYGEGLERDDISFLTRSFLPSALGEGSGIINIALRAGREGEPDGPDFTRVFAIGFTLLFPLRSRDEVSGACLLGKKASGVLYTGEDKAFIGALSGQVSAALEAREYYERWRREEKFTSLGRASATISHELRNPLNIIKGAVIYLKKRHQDEDVSRIAEIVNQEVNKTSQFIGQFLEASRVPPAYRRELEMGEWMRRFAGGWYDRFPDVKMEVSTPVKPLRVKLDPVLLEQLLENLCRNAAEAMELKGNLSVAVELLKPEGGDPYLPFERRSGEGVVLLTVSDDGPGIADDLLEVVFDPFFTTKSTGNGLGLCVVDGVARSHGGCVEIECPPGGGTSFKVFLLDGRGEETEREKK